MKKFVVFILLTALGSIVYSQNCTQPIPNQLFQQKYNQLKNRPSESSKLNTAKQIVNTSCFSSVQVKEIALLFENDHNRLEFAKIAYHKTTDKENFYEVYDAFIYYSFVFKLHDYIQDEKKKDNQIKVKDLDFVPIEYKYPSYITYTGKKNCTNLISEDRFVNTFKKIKNIKSKETQYNQSIEFVQNNCVATAYVMKLSTLLQTDELKYNLAKEAINSIYDIDNFTEFKQVFETRHGISKFITLINNQANQDNIHPCKVTENEYQKIINTIHNEKFNSSKLNTAKHLIQSKKCFTSEQIKGIINLFDYENSRLDIAFLAYDFVTDQSNYYSTVSQAIEFESNKKRLLDYINNKN